MSPLDLFLYIILLNSQLRSKELCWSHFGAKKALQRLNFGKTSYEDFVFAQSDFLRLVGAPNESFILIIIYYIFQYSVAIKRTLLESLQSKKKGPLKPRFRQNEF